MSNASSESFNDSLTEPQPDTIQSLEKQIADAEAAATAMRVELNDTAETLKVITQTVSQDRADVAAEIYRLQQELQAHMDKMRAELNERIKGLTDQQGDLTNLKWDQQRALRKQEQEVESLRRQLDQQRRAELAQAEWATLEKRWDQLTMGAPWREWAKDHQLDGARKITYEGRMILGDTMGLGKTLTSLIAIDMIEAATKDASPDNPIEFGSMK